MNVKMTNIIIDRLFGKEAFDQNLDSKKLLQTILQYMVIKNIIKQLRFRLKN